MLRIIYILLLLVLTSCAGKTIFLDDKDANDPLLKQSLELDIFSARGFLGGSEYERYYLTENILWRECGNITASERAVKKRTAGGNTVLARDPELNIQERQVAKLSNKESLALRRRALELMNSLSSKKSMPAPGSPFSLGDPGVFELALTLGESKRRMITSVDAISNEESDVLKYAHELFAGVRGVGPEICGAKTFYGIGRDEL